LNRFDDHAEECGDRAAAGYRFASDDCGPAQST
jgi:hypothetical protein